MNKYEDLACYSAPLTTIFSQPSTPEEWLEYALSKEQVQFYMDHGYLKGIQILTPEQVECFRSELAALPRSGQPGNELFMYFAANEAEDPEKVLFHALGAWRLSKAFHDLWWAPAYRMAAWQLMGGNLRAFHDQLFCKPAKHGGVVAWHQDYSYWKFTAPMQHLTCWLGLDDSSEENGCLWYVPGSHRWELLPITGLAGDMDAVNAVLDGDQREQMANKVPMVLGAGSACFHHPHMMHGSYANTSDRQRRAVVLNTMLDGTTSSDDHDDRAGTLNNFPSIPHGQPMTGSLFPILFDSEKCLGELAGSVPTVQSLK